MRRALLAGARIARGGRGGSAQPALRGGVSVYEEGLHAIQLDQALREVEAVHEHAALRRVVQRECSLPKDRPALAPALCLAIGRRRWRARLVEGNQCVGTRLKGGSLRRLGLGAGRPRHALGLLRLLRVEQSLEPANDLLVC